MASTRLSGSNRSTSPLIRLVRRLEPPFDRYGAGIVSIAPYAMAYASAAIDTAASPVTTVSSQSTPSLKGRVGAPTTPSARTLNTSARTVRASVRA